MKTAMKRIVVALLAIVSVLMLASCTVKPELDLEDAEKNLKKDGYTVYLVEKSEQAHQRRSLSATKDDSALVVIEFDKEETAKLYCSMVKSERDNDIAQMKAEIKYYKHLLKEYKEDLGELTTKAYEEKVKTLENDVKTLKNDKVVGRSGAYVWVGSKSALRASK